MRNSISKIVFIIWTPFNQRDHDRFGIDLLRKNGFDVEVFDFTPFLNPDGFSKCTVFDNIDFSNHCIFHSKREALKAINQLTTRHFIISHIPWHYKTYPIYRAISRNDIPYSANWTPNMLPLPSLDKRPAGVLCNLRRVTDRLRNLKLSNLLNFFYNQMPLKFLGVRSEALFCAGGIKSIRNNLTTATTKVLWIHALDYDLFLNERMLNAKAMSCKYAVFLDEYAPFHPDYVLLKLKPYVTPGAYFSLLNNFFDHLEKKHNIEVIVAAHPRSQYEKRSPYFGDRKVIKGKTIKLVRDAFFVILHTSTAINFAVLFEKPAVFITTNELQTSFGGPWIDAMASELGKRVHNLDEPVEIDIDSELLVDRERYKTYKNNYIKMDDTPELPFWQVVANELKTEEI